MIKSKVTLRFDNPETSYNAVELDDLIRSMIEARAGMNPPIPTIPPSLLSADCQVMHATSFSIARLHSGGLRVWARLDGLGWVSIEMSEGDRTELERLLVQPEPEPDSLN